MGESANQDVILLRRPRLPHLIAADDVDLRLLAELHIVIAIRGQKRSVHDAGDCAIVLVTRDLRLVGKRRQPPVRSALIRRVQILRD